MSSDEGRISPALAAQDTAFIAVSRLQHMTTASLLAALLGVTSWISAFLPSGPVPLTPQMFFVALAALMLPPAWAAASLAIYVALGAVGLPVFSAGRSGLGVLVGPTGGYLLGFIVAAGVSSLLRMRLAREIGTLIADVVAVTAAVVVVYAVGAAQLSAVADLTPAGALLAGVAPFVLVDAFKAGSAVVVAGAIRRARS